MVQLFTAIIYNANIRGFTSGTIFTGESKGVCVPGLNCYSCPGAVGSCPVGSLQAAINELKYKFPFYVVGTILLFGVLLGRTVCGFLCPFGFIQDLLDKVPFRKLRKGRWSRILRWLKYVVLTVFVLWIPIFTLLNLGVAVPGFCKYICPAGTLEAGIPLLLLNSDLRGIVGVLFDWKFGVLLALLTTSMFVYRPFCRFLCPLGAIYSLFHRISIIGYRKDEKLCNDCGACVRYCRLDVKQMGDAECIRCGECKSVCSVGAIRFSPAIRKRNK